MANEVKKQLESINITVWMDKEILGGDNWIDKIEEALRSSEVTLVLLDKNSAQSRYVTYEWAFALGKRRKVIPLVIEDCDIHKRIDSNILQHIDFRNEKDWTKLIQTIKVKLNES